MAKRLQVSISDDQLKALDKLVKETGVRSYSDLLNNALTLFRWAAREKGNQRLISSIDPTDGAFTELAMPALDRVRENASQNVSRDPFPEDRVGITEVHLPNQDQSSQKTSSILLNPISDDLYRMLVLHPELVKTLQWRQFEKLLADILETFGYEIDLMQGTKDGGIDIIAFGNSEEWGRHKYIVQAKRWSNRVGIEPVRELMFLHGHHRATKSCLATTSKFTKGAWELSEQYKWQLELRDYDGLKDWISRAYDIKYGLL